MEFLQLVVMLLGVAVLIATVYLLVTGGTIPPGVIKVFLIAVALLVIVCLAHTTGCRMPIPQG